MKICIVGSSGIPIPPKYGGAVERHIFDLARNLVNLGHDVHILTIREENETKESIIEGIFVHRISEYRPSGNLKSLWKHITFFNSILKLLGSNIHSFDIFHAHNGIPGFSTMIASRLKKVPFIYTCHLPFTNIHHKAAWGEGFLKNIFNDMQVFFEKFCVKHADQVIATSRFVKEGLLAVGVKDEKIIIVHNGVDVEKFKFSPERAQNFREKFGLNNKKVILFIGRIVSYKGLDTLIEAASYIIKTIKNAFFVIVGPISYYGKAKTTKYYLDIQRKIDDKELRDYFLFTGTLNEQELLGAYSACDVLVLPSTSEGFGMVLIEGMSCGKNVIGTSVGGIIDIITDGINGFLIAPRSSQDLADKIIRLFLSPNEKNIGESARKDVIERFSWDIIALKVVDIYNQNE